MYCLFHKPQWRNKRLHFTFDQPLKIVKKILRRIVKWLSLLPSRKKMFENSKNFFEQRLQPSGFNEKLNYTEENSKTSSKSPKHNILCFNPPYSKSDKIDIDQFVLHLVNKNFLPVRKYKKIFKRNIYAQHQIKN